MDYYSGRLWPDVTSPLARRVLTEAFNLAPIDAEDTFYDIYKLSTNHDSLGHPIDEELEEYRKQVRNRLEISDLAARVLDPWWIDAMYESLPESRRRFLLLFRPRGVEGAVRHYMNNLDWYLGLTPELKRSWVKPTASVGGFVLLAVVLLFVWLSLSNVGVFVVAPLMLFGVAALVVLDSRGKGWFSETKGQRWLVARAEFYLYLRNALRDNSEP